MHLKKLLLTHKEVSRKKKTVNRKHGHKKMHSAVSTPVCSQHSIYFLKHCENTQQALLKKKPTPGFGVK